MNTTTKKAILISSVNIAVLLIITGSYLLTKGDGTSELASGSTNAGLTGNNTNGEHDATDNSENSTSSISGGPENLTNRIINAGAGANNGSASNENTDEDEEKSQDPVPPTSNVSESNADSNLNAENQPEQIIPPIESGNASLNGENQSEEVPAIESDNASIVPTINASDSSEHQVDTNASTQRSAEQPEINEPVPAIDARAGERQETGANSNETGRQVSEISENQSEQKDAESENQTA